MIVVISLMFAGCSSSYTPEVQTITAQASINRIDELFVSGNDGGKVRTEFVTSSMQYWTQEGKSIWTVWGSGGGNFMSRTVEMGKSSGYSGGGYGIVFCQGEYIVNGVQQPVMLVVMINNDGNYIIGKAIGGVFKDSDWWKTTPYLNQGAGAGNEVKVSYEAESDEFRLDINGYFVESFRDDDEPRLRSGKDGYVVVITPFDQFPQSGIAVYFREDR